MARTLDNPDRNFSADGNAENNDGRRNEAVKRKIVASRFRRFFGSLITQLTAGSAELWNKAEQPRENQTSDPQQPKNPSDRPP